MTKSNFYNAFAENNDNRESPGPEIKRTPFQLICIEIEKELYKGGYITETEDDREPVWRVIEKYFK